MREYNNVKLRLLYITLFPETTKYKTLKSTIILSYSDPTPI